MPKKPTLNIDYGDGVSPTAGYSGVWEVYWPNRRIKLRAYYLHGKEEGEYLCFWENGHIAQRGCMLAGECTGVWVDYDYDGNKSLEGEYVHGKHGVWRSFWSDGCVMSEEEFHRGFQHGFSRHYSANGDLKYAGVFRVGQPYSGICHVTDLNNPPFYRIIAQFEEGRMMRQLPESNA